MRLPRACVPGSNMPGRASPHAPAIRAEPDTDTARAAGFWTRNRLLGALPASRLEQAGGEIETVSIGQHEVLFRAGQPVSHVYFPETLVVSFFTDLRDRESVEIATAGCEGLVGLPVLLGADLSSMTAVVQIPGVARRMRTQAFSRFIASERHLRKSALRYAHAFLMQVGQTAACNGSHLLEERCARWLLTTHDRVEDGEFLLTHEFLAQMLGVRRAGVTLAMLRLQETGLVANSRGRVRILDRAGLERVSCGCYEAVRRQFDQLIPGRAMQAQYSNLPAQ